MTIIEAIKEVMKGRGKPMTVSEVHSQIVANKLYEFKAVNPVHIVNSQIRRHCKGIPNQKSYSKTKHFKSVGDNKYYFLEQPEVFSEEGLAYKEYWLPKINNVRPISSRDILKGDEESQVAVLKEWFLSEYKPVVKNSQGGYIYLLDGPYEAIDVLNNEFLGILQTHVIRKVAETVEKEFRIQEWSKIPKDKDIEEYSLEDPNTNFYKNFENTIKSIELLIGQSNVLRNDLQQIFNRMLYANIITAMESYLADALINAVYSDEANLRRLIEETPELRERKLNLGNIYKRLELLSDEVKEYLVSLVYHKLDKVKELYYHTLGIEFPENLSNIFRAILKRHDIVHRNGKDKDGNILDIRSQDIHSLLGDITLFIKEVDKQLSK